VLAEDALDRDDVRAVLVDPRLDVALDRQQPLRDVRVSGRADDRDVEAWIDKHSPDVVAVERVFSQHNVRTVMGTAQASALAIAAAARRGIPVALHTPSEVKAAVTGQGRAGKEQVAFMVRRVLNAPALAGPPDATDALALAICQLWRGAATAKVQRALAGVTR
jgi:crossover junction endodeoxyribonuclease RuvC